jgi:hypothetical protein
VEFRQIKTPQQLKLWIDEHVQDPRVHATAMNDMRMIAQHLMDGSHESCRVRVGVELHQDPDGKCYHLMGFYLMHPSGDIRKRAGEFVFEMTADGQTCIGVWAPVHPIDWHRITWQ